MATPDNASKPPEEQPKRGNDPRKPVGPTPPSRGLFGVLTLALLAMLGARSLNRDRYLMLESLIVSMTMAMLLWVLLLQPALDRSTMGPIDRWLSLVLPLSDLVLVAFAARLVLGVDSRSRSLTLLLLGLVVRLFGNSVAHWMQMAGNEPNTLVNVLIAVSLLLFAAAALDPSGNVDMRSAPPPVHLDRVRLTTMLACALLPQVVVLVFAVRGDASRSTLVLASAIAALVTTLAIAHLWGLAVSVRDLTAREGEDRLASLVDRSSDVVVLVDANGQISYTSGAMTSVLGYAADRWYRWSVYDLPIEPTSDTWLHAVQRLRALEPETSLSMEVSAKHADGGLRLMELTAVDLRQNSAVAGTVLTLRDVTATRTLQGQLRFRADHDELTGLANRAQFLARLNRDLLGDRRPIVMFIDLDDFKSINDTLGHESGDVLLNSVATRLRKRIPDERGLVARLGGDEFPVRIARGDIALKGPDIRHFADFLWIAIDHLTCLVVSGGDHFADEGHSNRGLAPAHQGGRLDGGLVNTHETRLDAMTLRLSLIDGARETVEDFLRKKVLECCLVTLGKAIHDHLIGHLRTLDEGAGRKARISLRKPS
jgi:PAS domain S-box-containing protein